MKLVALAAVVAVAAAGIVYERAWRDGAARSLPYRDATAQLPGLEPAREADRLFVDAKEFAKYVGFADPGYTRPLARIDFARDEAVFVTTGPRSSSGYSVRVVSVVEERGRVVVTLREQTPAPADPTQATVTYPYRLLVLRSIDKPVSIVWQGRT